MIQEVILCKYGEIILKGQNRRNFESMLIKELRRRASPFGTFKIYYNQSTIYVEPQDDACDMDGMYESAKKVFGIVTVCRGIECEKNMDVIYDVLREHGEELLGNARTFKCDAKRSDKKFPLTSPQICTECGAVLRA